ncbi:MAG: response regulator [Anaerolineae bacterium]|jgi:CheY-like chemotaxis protein
METIVVVDDDKVFRELLKAVLEMEGYRAVLKGTPEDIVPTVREEVPALVLMDIHIKNRDTLGALQALKNDEDLKHIPVLMISGMDRRRECVKAGADGFVMKPFLPSEILEKIGSLLDSRQ